MVRREARHRAEDEGACMEAEKGDGDNPAAMFSRLRLHTKADAAVMPIAVRIGSNLAHPETDGKESLMMREAQLQGAERHDLYKQRLHDMYIEVIHGRSSH